MTDILESVIQDTLVNLVRRVQWGLTREELERQAKALIYEASFERSMADNHSTANDLTWKAELSHFAAQVRFPREGDIEPARMRRRVKVALRDMSEGIEDEWTPQLAAIHSAINQSLAERRISFDEIERFVFADKMFEEDRELERQAAFWETRDLVADYRRELAQEPPESDREADNDNQPRSPRF